VNRDPVDIAASDDRENPGSVERGDEQLQKALSGLRSRVTGHLENFTEGLEDSLTGPVREAYRLAQAEHGRLMEAAGLHAVGEESDSPLTWDRLRAYREAVRSDVLEPLRSALENLEVGRQVALRWEGFQNGLPEFVEELPGKVTRVEPRDLYRSRPGEGPWLKGRKSLVRLGRGFVDAWNALARASGRLLRRSYSPPPPRSQVVPLKRLARRCVLKQCPVVLEPFTEAIHQHYAIPLSTLASGVLDWARAWYPAEDLYHHPEDHLAPATRERLHSLLSTLRMEAPDTGTEGRGRYGTLPDPDNPAPPASDPRIVAQTLQGILTEGASLEGPVKAMDRIREAMEGEWDRLLEQVRVAGSLQEEGNRSEKEARVKRLDTRLRTRGDRWHEWHTANLSRMSLPLALMRVREGWDRAEDQLLGALAEDSLLPILDPLVQAGETLRAMGGEAHEILTPEVMEDDPEKAATIVDHLTDRSRTVLDEGLVAPMNESEAFRKAGARVEATVGILSDTLRSAPALLTLCPPREDPDRVEPRVELRKVPLRENLLKIVDVVRLETIRTAPAPILEILENARHGHETIPEIASFNLSSAREELTTPSDSNSADKSLQDTKELVTDGLERTAEAIQTLLVDLPPAWRTFLQDSHRFFTESFRELHGRTLVEGSVQEQILDFRSRVESHLRNGLEALRTGTRDLNRAASRLFRRLRIRGLRLARLGRSAVGMDPHLQGEAERALEILRDSPQLLESLPLVYRKLFSFQPLNDPSLLIGREDALDWVNRRFQAWKEGAGVPGVLQGDVGSGHTSLLNVVTQTIFSDAEVSRLDLDFRPENEEELARWLTGGLGLEGAEIRTLDQIRERLSADHGGPRTRVVLLENLEHLFLRLPRGTELVEEFLALQTRTGDSILWISTTSTAAWKYLTRVEPATANMASTFTLSLPSREVLAETILTRHQRSGLGLEFLEPPNLGPLVRRKLKRARGEKARQEVLREEFFDRLHRMAEGSVAMAILFWLHAVDFAGSKGKVRVNPPRNVRFAFLEDLDLPLDFALMALLEHGTLTLGEFARVFQSSSEDAWQIFEVLRARMLVEPGSAENSLPRAVTTISEDIRYRIPPILGQVVSQRLRNRNILH